MIVGADLAPSCQKSLIPRLDRQAMAPPSLPVDQFQKNGPLSPSAQGSTSGSCLHGAESHHFMVNAKDDGFTTCAFQAVTR